MGAVDAEEMAVGLVLATAAEAFGWGTRAVAVEEGVMAAGLVEAAAEEVFGAAEAAAMAEGDV